ncbi:DUF3617 domain-containing protein [Ectothiorhodospira lacustris]|uniref:DUF3617 domain-containing protein n=1 Tax=Ectothiorhodospira lacustris TaxID=2899127 RepID=UPI001EE7F89F|nr:DUF3617 family protein [Ectothiorhodospira lacustris]MCG5501821.1 DUF3617 domain-containing protein [Ectothiorhodospira lacustris]MCG5510259.1 DUF3617 domain-containing protein [Ectothiorhodospira lacustris]MCG5521874.1 DUF3617 domain-containing protein [Ectothiorhodospira lacustris]
MMRVLRPVFIAGTLLMLSHGALATDLNIQPGDWEFTNVTRILGDSPFPEHTTTNRQCITAEDVAKGPQFMDLSEHCDMSNLQVTSGTMRYDMLCRENGMEVQMTADMTFQGDRLSGQVNAELEGPMGRMPMQTDITARRVGDCP